MYVDSEGSRVIPSSARSGQLHLHYSSCGGKYLVKWTKCYEEFIHYVHITINYNVTE